MKKLLSLALLILLIGVLAACGKTSPESTESGSWRLKLQRKVQKLMLRLVL
ncbi:hypothetical protein KHA80_04790 [Anaerobacillus sp. HL2]|nr:hypothetical protein KHA80_04790 [Anaerobacillus sp. HL2]